MLFRPAESSKEIADFYRRYLLSTFKTNREYYNRQMEEQLSKEGMIANGPYISMSDSYAKDSSIRELVAEGVLCPSMMRLSALHPDRKLYVHQSEAIRKAVLNQNLVITTGTGSGKTECFLIPVLNQLMREKEEGTLGPGVRTLIIYPMNALVNDQIRRLRELFKDYVDDDITFGKFTGETEERYSAARDQFIEREGCAPKKNELISREQMREAPPNILITNYAMLEYILLRPGDNVFFNSENSQKWRHIVLDEAHTYGGATGIEVGTLLKRVSAMLNRKDIQFMLTSATLGGKDDNQRIVNFAEALCNVEFASNGIIRSVPAPPQKPEQIEKLDFDVYRELAILIRDNYAPEEMLKSIAERGVEVLNAEPAEEALANTLYNMILHDTFYYEVRSCLLGKTKPLHQVALELRVSTDDIADFIAVASNAQINGDKIFEARYHMFLRGIEGVYVTLSPSNKLFVKRMETYKEDPYSDDIGFKAYEISFCHNCEAIFIVGQTSTEGKLVQMSKINDEYSPEVYLIDGDYDPDVDDPEEEQDNHYLLCSKCGAIARESAVGGLNCGHDKRFHNRIIKVKDRGDILHSCPCCHAVNTQRSILRPYFLGNEAATAVIATALYDVLPDKKITKRIIKLEDQFFGSGTSETLQTTEEHLVKQFLTFSDNRQAAAFFASYLSNTYQASLLKRLMTEVKLQNEALLSRGIRLSDFVNLLEEMMNNYNVCEEGSRHKQAWLTVASEMINYKARNSLQSEGTLFFDIDIKMGENKVLGLTAEETTTLFKTLALTFIKDGAFVPPVQLTEADFALFSFGKQINGYQKNYTKAKYTKSWLPKEGKENTRTRMIQKLFPGKDLNFATSLLNAIWTVMLNNQCVIYYDSTQGKYLIDLDKIIVRAVDKLYICESCKVATPYFFKSKCVCNNCDGKLIPYDVDKAKKNDHYKRMYETLKIDPLVAKEHTAQLGSQKAYDYQSEFKKESINVLSCSTTFEMGVDVGTLETVFMRNMPPTPANYAQRAGRAGRSVKSAAYALTYCPNNSHDLNFFKNPVAMIKGVITPPAFNVNNEKIVLRHVFASAFSFFWKKYPELYKRHIGEFVDCSGIRQFEEYLLSKPEDLRAYLESVVSADLQVRYGVADFKWVDLLFSKDTHAPGVFTIAAQKYQADVEQLIKANKEYEERLRSTPVESREYKDLLWKNMAVSRSIRTIKEQQLIAFLSLNNLIPKYGFPVDTVELKSLGQSAFMDSLRLDRDLYTAISEYAPDSQVVADGMLITSRYVRKLGEYEWPKYNYSFCDNCKTLNKTIWTEELPENCKQCGHPLRRGRHQYIIPKFGFVVDNKGPEPVGTSKPERTYKGSISYIGDGNKIENHSYSICGKKVTIGTSKMDELAVLNTSNFYICNECGYGEVFENCYDLAKKKTHKKSDGYTCSNTSLTPYALGHEFQTDVVQIKFESENITEVERAWTILYALLEGLSKSLHIDRNELSGCLHWYRNQTFGGIGNYDFVLFDNTPGGAGYVRNLRNPATIVEMMKEGMRIVSECTCGGDAADTACYGCLCNYYNQKQHDILQRRYAIEFFTSLQNGKPSWSAVRLEDEDNNSTGLITIFNDDGQDQSDMAYTDIWDYLSDDTENVAEKALLAVLSSLSTESMEKPYYGGSLKIVDSGISIPADLIWKRSKLALFLSENKEAYDAAQASNWKVFRLDDDFDPLAFISSIVEG